MIPSLLHSSRIFISVIAPWMVTGFMLTVGVLLILSLPKMFRMLQRIHPLVKIVLIFTILMGGFIRFAWVPDGHRIFFDEERYLSYAVNFARHGTAVSLIVTTQDQVILGDPDPAARVTVPVINAWTLKILGYEESHLFLIARIVSIVTIILIFFAVYLLFGDQIAATIAAVLVAFLPIMVYWSVSTNIDSYFVTFSLLALIGAVRYARKPTLTHVLFAWCGTSLLLFVRFESFLFLPTLMLTVGAIRRYVGVKLWSRKDLLLTMLLVPIILIRATVSVPVFSSTWCCAEATPLEIFSTTYIFRNTIPNLFTFVNRLEFPAVLSLLAGVYLCTWHYSKSQKDFRLLIFVPWILAYFFIYSFYYAGQYYSFTFSGSYGRFFLMEVAPISILASLQISRGMRYFSTAPFEKRNWIVVLSVCALLSLIPSLLSYRTLIATSPWDNLVEVGPRRLHHYIDDVMIPKTPPESAIIFGVLAPIHLAGKTVIYTDAFLENDEVIEFVIKYIQSGKPVFTFETHTCELFPEKCVKILKKFEFVPYAPANDNRYEGFEMRQVVLKKL